MLDQLGVFKAHVHIMEHLYCKGITSDLKSLAACYFKAFFFFFKWWTGQEGPETLQIWAQAFPVLRKSEASPQSQCQNQQQFGTCRRSSRAARCGQYAAVVTLCEYLTHRRAKQVKDLLAATNRGEGRLADGAAIPKGASTLPQFLLDTVGSWVVKAHCYLFHRSIALTTQRYNFA